MDTYSKYIASSLYFIATRKLPEFERINSVEMARLRIRQLFIMNISLNSDFIDDEIWEFSKTLNYSPSSIEFIDTIETPSNNDVINIDKIVKFSKRILKNINKLESSRIPISMFGSVGTKISNINKSVFDSNSTKVKKTYIEFHNYRSG